MRKKIKQTCFALLTGMIIITAGWVHLPAITYAEEYITDEGTTLPADEIPVYTPPVVEQPVYTPPVYTEPTPLPAEEPQAEPATEDATPQAVTDVMNAINGLPAAEDITLEAENTVADIRTAFNALSKADQAKVTNSVVLDNLETKLKELQKEAEQAKKEEEKKYVYSFEIPTETKSANIVLQYEGKTPELTLVSPEENPVIIEKTEATFSEIQYQISEETEVVSEKEENTTAEASSESKPKDVENTDVKSKQMIIHIFKATPGVWTLKSTEALNIATEEFTDPNKKEPETQPTTEPETEKAEPEKTSSLPPFIQNIIDKVGLTKLLIYVGGGIVAIIVFIILLRSVLLQKKRAGLKSGKKPKSKRNTFPPEDDMDDDYDDYDDDNRAYPPSPHQNPPIDDKSSGHVPQNNKKRKPTKKKQLIDEEMDVSSLEISETFAEDDEIAKIKAAADEMWAKLEPESPESESHDHAPSKPETAPAYIDYDDEIQYITQEDIDNDVTIEEYIDGEVVSANQNAEEVVEKVKKRRSFFPEDRFS